MKLTVTGIFLLHQNRLPFYFFIFWRRSGRAYAIGHWQVCAAVQSATARADRPVVSGKGRGHPVPTALTADRGGDALKAHASHVARPGARTLTWDPVFNAPFAESHTVLKSQLCHAHSSLGTAPNHVRQVVSPARPAQRGHRVGWSVFRTRASFQGCCLFSQVGNSACVSAWT